jgi:hypothetical protein
MKLVDSTSFWYIDMTHEALRTEASYRDHKTSITIVGLSVIIVVTNLRNWLHSSLYGSPAEVILPLLQPVCRSDGNINTGWVLPVVCDCWLGSGLLIRTSAFARASGIYFLAWTSCWHWSEQAVRRLLGRCRLSTLLGDGEKMKLGLRIEIGMYNLCSKKKKGRDAI